MCEGIWDVFLLELWYFKARNKGYNRIKAGLYYVPSCMHLWTVSCCLHSHFGMPKTKLKQMSAHWWKGGAATHHIQSEEKSHQILVKLMIDSSV